MSKVMRLFAAALSTSLVLLALIGPGAVAATQTGSATPDAAPGWPLCAPWGTTRVHCHTPRECFGNYQVIKYWTRYPGNLYATEYTGVECV